MYSTNDKISCNISRGVQSKNGSPIRRNNDFKKFIALKADKDDTFKFWSRYVFEDGLAYISLFLAMRSGDWDLHMCSIKNMAAIFTAFDHPIYQKLISFHVHDTLNMPEAAMLMFRQGAFVVNIDINGRDWHSVGIDEAHERLINKECKNSVVRPTEDYLRRVASHLMHHTKATEKGTVPHIRQTRERALLIVFNQARTEKKVEKNINAQMNALSQVSLLNTKDENRGLYNPFNKQNAEDVRLLHLLTFREIGEKEYRMRILYYILKTPSTSAPNRRRALQTFSTKSSHKKRVSQLERDQKLVLTAIKRKILFAQKASLPVEKPGEQLVQLPLSLCDSEGKPHSGQKSYFLKSLEARYKNCSKPLIANDLPLHWKPRCTLLEGMFMINTIRSVIIKPWKTMGPF